MVSYIQKCARALISTITYFSIAASRFSLSIGSELKCSSCFAFFYAVLELPKFLFCRELSYLFIYKEIAYKKCV